MAAAREAGGGYIVFDVAGTIELIRPAEVFSNTYIAGHSAPGRGIAITREPILIRNANDILIRNIRCRGDYELGRSVKGQDAILIIKSQRVILDHVSVSFFQDGAVDIVESRYITLQWSHFGDAVNSGTWEAYHGEPHLIRTNSNFITMHHNYYTHTHSRTPWFHESSTRGGMIEFSNNVVYNFRKYPSAFDVVNGQGNAVGNYYIPGTNTHGDHGIPKRGAIIGSHNFTLFAMDNRFIHSSESTPGHDDQNCKGSDHDTCRGNDQRVTGSRPDNSYPEDAIMSYKGKLGQSHGHLNFTDSRFESIPKVTYLDAEKNMDEVISKFGALPRDNTDLRLQKELLTRTGSWKLEKPLDNNDYSGTPNKDTDRDGMADEWENQNGGNLKPNGRDLSPDYDNIEIYLQDLHNTLRNNASAVNAHTIVSGMPTPLPPEKKSWFDIFKQ
ncbi:MAG: hypothetical protein MI799_16570 [Desulfobacterales bacterium]|nr:hypothetical protein [Desulfobacterales bacterium]